MSDMGVRILSAMLLTFILTFVCTVWLCESSNKKYAENGFIVINKKLYKLTLVEMKDETQND